MTASPNLVVVSRKDFRAAEKPLVVKHGNTVIKIYPVTAGGYIFRHYDRLGIGRLVRRSTLEKIKAEARAIAELRERESLTVKTFVANLTDDKVHEHLELLQACTEAGFTPGQAAAHLRAWHTQNSRANIVAKTCPQLVAELLNFKRAEEAGGRWIDDLESRLNKFAKDFTGPFESLSAADLRTWLVNLKDKNGVALSKRSRNNYRTALIALVAFAKDHRLLRADWDELKTIKPHKIAKGIEEIYTPDEMRKLLFAAEDHYPQHLPAFAIMGLGGCRHCELREEADLDAPVLNWEDVHFETGLIHVDEQVAKSNTGRRYVPMQPSLVAWLKLRAKARGPICQVANLTNALRRIAAKAGVPFKQNGLRNSFISYRCAIVKNVAAVAGEAGNSEGEIQGSYRKEIPEAVALKYFNILPGDRARERQGELAL